MNPRQGVIIAMFLSMTVYLLANAQASVITARTNQLKQTSVTPVPTPANLTPIPRELTDQRPTNLGGVNA